MNKTYRVVYNETTRTYTAVAEIATARGKSAGVVDGTVSAQTTVRKPKGRMIAGWTLGAALLNFSMMFGFTMLPAAEAVAATCVMNGASAGSTAGSNNSLACGAQATTGQLLNSTAIGYQANAKTDNATAIGSQTVSNGSGNVAAGSKANADGAWSTAVGGESRTVDGGGTATGYAAVASKDSTAIGALASAGYAPTRDPRSGLITDLGNKTGGQAVALGYKATASGDQSLAIGGDTVASGAASVAIGGDDLDALANNAGLNATFSNLSGETLSANVYKGTTSSGAGSVAMGVQAESGGAFATTVGTRSVASGAAATAMGVASTASGNAAFAGAAGAKATGTNSVALGAQTDATALRAIAVGQKSQATANDAMAVGSAATATADGASALGLNANALATNAVALGVRATVTDTGNKGVAIGEDATSSNEKSIAIGAASKSSGDKSIAVGDSANATNTHSFAMGGSSLSTGTNALAIGSNTKATGDFSIAQGNAANASAEQAQAMGVEAVASAAQAVAIGPKAQATAVNTFAGGVNAVASGQQAVAVGSGSQATANNTIALGNSAQASGANAIASGVSAKAAGSSAIASGNAANASGNESVAIGRNALSSGANSVATGYGAQATANQAIATGQNAQAIGISSIALGQNAKSGATNMNNTIAIGTSSNVTAASAVAIGQNANSHSTHALALGNSATVGAGFNHAVALGSYSTVAGAVATPNHTFNGITYGFAGGAPAVGDVVSVGEAAGRKRQIQNVAAGQISSSSTDAINGSQLYSAITESHWKLQANGAQVGDVNFGDKVNFKSTDGSVTITPTAETGGVSTLDLQIKRGLGITLDNNSALAVATTVLDQHATNMRFSTPRGQQNSFVKADDLARHLNNVGFNLSGEAQAGTFEDLTTSSTHKQLRNGDTLTMIAGPNIKINQVNKGFEFSVEGENVAYAGNKATVPTTDEGYVATVKSVAEAINHSGFTLKTSANGGEKVSGADEVINPGDVVDMAAGKNLTVKQEANGKITYATKNEVEFDKVTTNNLTVNPNGNVNMGGNTISNVGSGGDTDTNAANIADVKNARTVVTSNDNTVTVTKTSDGLQDTYDLSVNTSVPTTTLTTDKGNVTTPATPDSYVTAGNLATTINTAVASAKEKVEAGTNIVSVDSKVNDTTGATTYTVNAKGTTASVADGDTYLSVTPSDKGNNVTDYQIGLSQSTKDSLAKADTAVQSFTTAVKGATVDTINQQNTVINFVDGVGTTATIKDNDITFDVNKAKLSTDTTGNVTSDKTGDNFVTGEDVANAINEAAKLTEKTTTVVAGSNTHVQEKLNGNNTEYTVSADKATVSVSSALTKTENATTDATTGAVTTDYALDLSQTTKDDIKKGVDAKDIVDNKGLTFTGDSGSTNVEKLGSTVAVNGDTNIVTSAQGDQISIKLKDDITVNSVTANNTTTNNLTVKPNGNVDMGGNQITNVASGGDVDTNAANIGDVKTAVAAAKEKVIAGTNVASVVEGTEDGRTTFTVNAKGTTASSANEDYVTVKAGTPNGENVTDYAVDLSEKAKESLSKADTAVQSFTTSVNGVQAEELNQANKDVNFVNGTGTTARNVGGDITFDVNKAALTTNDAGNVTNNNAGDTFVTGDDVAKAINEATARTEKTTSVVKGSNTHVQSKVDGNETEYTVSADKATVSVSSALTKTETPTTDATTGAVTTDYALDLSQTTKDDIKKGVDAKDIVDNKGLTFTGDSGSTNVEKLGSTVAVKGDSNITTAASGDEISIKLNENITVNNVTTNGLTVNPNGNVDMGGNTITNVGSGGTTGTNAANIDDVKNAATKVTSNDGSIKVASSTSGLQTTYDISVPTTNLTTDKGTVNTPAAPNSYVTAGNLATTINTAVASAKEKVEAGTNIVSVDSKVDDTTGATTYTVNAKGTTASVAQGDKYLTVSESPKDGNVTDYQFGLTQSAKDSLFKADTALQSFTTSVNGTPVETINQENSDVGFVNGNVTTAAQSGRDITFDVNFDDKTLKQDGNKLAVNTTTLTPSATDGTVTAGNPDNLATAGDIANAINKAGFKLTATATASEGGEVAGTSEELVNAGETVTIDAGKNIKLTQAAGKITVATKDNVEFNNVTVNGDVTAGDTVLNKDGLTINNGNTDNKPVTLTKDGLDNGGNTITNVARGEADTDAVNVSQLKEVSNVANAGWNLTAQGENSSNVAANDTVDLNNTDGNIVVSKTADQDDVTFNLAKDIKVDSVTIENGNAGKPVTLSKDGLDNGGNKVTNVADGDINADSKDAVNGSQLFNNAQSIANNLGGGSTVNNDGTVSAPSYTVTNPADGSNRQVNNVGDAVDALNNAVNSPLTFAGDSGTEFARKLGQKVNVKGGATGNLTDNNIAVVANGTDTLDIKLAEKVDLGTNGEVKAGDTTVNNDGITINNGTAGEPVTLTKDGLNNGGNKVTNVADGDITADSKDAVNGSQLHDIIEKGFKIAADQGSDDTVKLGETVAYRSESGNIVTKVSDNKIDFDLADKITVGNNTANPVTIDGTAGTVTGLSNKTWDPANIVSGQAATEDQLKQVSNVANAGWNLTANGENRSNVAANDTVDLNNTDGNIDISKKADEDKVTFNLAKDITVDSVTAGDSKLTSDGLTINNGTAGNPVKLTKDGLDNGGNKVTNVADGTENSDAVNLSQLKAAKEDVTSKDKTVNIDKTGKTADGATVFDLSVNVDGTTITQGDNGELKANTTTLTPSETEGTVTAGNPDNLATAGDIANAINKAGFKLTASASEGEVSGDSEELVNAGETVTIDAGKNIKLTQVAGKITVATKDDVTFNNVTVNGDVKAGETTLNNDGVKVGDTTLTKAPITVNGNTVNNVNDAINQTAAQAFSPLTFAGDSGNNVERKLGTTLNVKGGATGNLTDNNIAVVANGTDRLDIKLAEKVDLGENGEVKAGDTTVNNDGVKVGDNVALTSDGLKAGDVSVTTNGLDNGGNQIKNVAAGTEDTDGVNVSQLKAAQAAATTKVEGTEGVEVTSSENADKSTTYTVKAKTDGITTKLDDAGNITANTTKLENSDKGTVNTPENPDALATAGDIANAINNAGFNVKSGGNKADGDEAAAELVKAGEEVELNAGKNLKVKRTGKVFTFETADDVAFNNVTVAGDLTAGDTVLNKDGITINNGNTDNKPVTLTKDGLDNGGNKITNVAAGKDDTDAVNVSQLKDAQAAATTKVVEGDNIVVTPETNADGSTTYKVETAKEVKFDSVTTGDTVMNNDGVKVGDTTLTKTPITVNGNTVNNVNDAINQTAAQAFSPLTFAGDSGNNVERKLGTTLNVKGGATGNLTDNNIAVVANGTDTLDIKLAEKVDLGENGEVKAGDTTVNNDGVKVGDNVALTSDGLKAGDVSVTDKGLDNGNNQIKNVAAGTEDTDGVNVSQLKAAQAAATTKVVEGDNMVVTSKTNGDGSITYTVATAKEVKFDKVTTGDTVMNNDGVKVGDNVALNSDGLKAGDVSVTDKGLDNGGNQIKNVAAGTEDTDGVNVSQLKAAQAAAKTEVKGTGLATVGTPTKGANGQDVYTVDVAKAKAPTVTDGKVSVEADDAGKVMVAGDVVNAINGSGFTLTTSASDGEVSGTSKELVNPGKTVTIDAGKNIKLTQAAGKITVATQDDVAFNSVTAKTVTADTVSATTVQAGDTTVDNSGVTINNGTAGIPVALTKDGLNNGGNRITNVAPGVEDTDAVNIGQLKAANANVHNRIDGVESNANAGVAQAMATAGLPQAYLPGKSMMAIGGGVYRGETGYAIGFSSISDGGNWIVKGTASGNSRGNYGATAAVGYQW